MRRLSPRVNVIPVIGKADSFTPSELAQFKKRVMEDIEHYSIPVYNFPYDVEEDDDETIQDNSELRAMLPFALIGAAEEIEIDGELVRARRYPWGIVEIDNPKHSDFGRLRTALLTTHLTDLKEITHDFLYENYRSEKLSRTVNSSEAYNSTDKNSILPEDMATQSVRLKEEQLRKEEEKVWLANTLKRQVLIRVQNSCERSNLRFTEKSAKKGKNWLQRQVIKKHITLCCIY